MILVIGPRLEGHSAIFLAIQTHPSCRFPPQDFPKQVPGHGDFRHLERDVPAMADNFGPDLDQLLS